MILGVAGRKSDIGSNCYVLVSMSSFGSLA